MKKKRRKKNMRIRVVLIKRVNIIMRRKYSVC